MRKFVGLLISAAISVSMLTVAQAEKVEFTDLDDSTVAWAVDYINEMAELGFVTGYEDGTYQPHKSVTRHEVFALMARVIGSRDINNSEFLDAAVEKYGPMLDEYDITWGVEEISFLLHKGVIKESDIKLYLAGDRKSEAMPRSEIAVIITKAVGAESELGDSKYIITYNDLNDISTTMRPYVAFVSEKGIMNGMDDGNFSPNTSVLRSQIAAILSRVNDYVDVSTDTGILDTIDEESKSISYYDENDMLVWTSYQNEVNVTVEGKTSSLDQLEKGASAVLTFYGEDLKAIDVVEGKEVTTFSAKYVSRSVMSGVTRITLKKLTGDKETVSYECAPGFEMTYNGEKASILDFSEGDLLEITLTGQKITAIAGKPGSEKITGAIVKAIDVDPDYTITISHSDPELDNTTYSISDTASVSKNSEKVTLSEVYAGDTVTITLTYGEVTAISAFSQSKVTTGVIKSITISSAPSIVVTIDKKDNEFVIAKDVVIERDGKEATLYDFRVGDTVSIRLEGSAVVKLSATASAQSVSGSVEGKVTAVNTSYGFIRVSFTNSSGYEVEETIYCNDTTTNIINSTGKNLKLRDVKVGSMVSAHGTVSSGAFNAKVVVVTE